MCVCVRESGCACPSVCVVYEDTHLYDDMGIYFMRKFSVSP